MILLDWCCNFKTFLSFHNTKELVSKNAYTQKTCCASKGLFQRYDTANSTLHKKRYQMKSHSTCNLILNSKYYCSHA